MSKQSQQLVTRGIFFTVGVALMAWGFYSAVPIPYLLGLFLTAVISAALLHHLLQARWTRKKPGDPPRRYRRRTAILGGLVALCLIIIGVGGPWVARLQVVEPNVRWRADVPHGHLIDFNENVYVVDRMYSGADENSVHVVDTRDGTVRWGAPGKVYITHDGGILSVDDDLVSQYDSDGQREWERTIPLDEHETLRVLAENDGHAVLATCGSDDGANEETFYCQFTGVDAHGDVAWKQEKNGGEVKRSLTKFSEFETEKWLGPLPSTAVLYNDTDLVMLDPATGEELGSIQQQGDAIEEDAEIYGEHLVYATSTNQGCHIAGYSMKDGNRLWRSELKCGGESGLDLFQVDQNTSHAFLNVFENDGADRLFSVETSAGAIEELPLEEIGGNNADLGDARLALNKETTDNLRLSWNGASVTAFSLTDGNERWNLTVPGEKVKYVTSGNETIVFVTVAEKSHNPFIPSDPDYPANQVTVVDEVTGAVLSSSLFPQGTGWATIPARGIVYIQDPEGATLLDS